MTVLLQGLAIKFFRGIGQQTQYLFPLKTFNFFVGSNNAGKSTVLDCLHRYGNADEMILLDPDRHQGPVRGVAELSFAIPIATFMQRALDSVNDPIHRKLVQDPLKKLMDGLFPNHEAIFVTRQPQARHPRFSENISTDEARQRVSDTDVWHKVWQILTHHQGGSMTDWVPHTLRRLLELQQIEIPKVHLIPSKREIFAHTSEFDDYSGKGLVKKLAEFQSPDFQNHVEHSQKFSNINRFLQTVTDRENARIEIPHHREHIIVHMNDKVLPLANLGTGIQEVIMIAAFCTLAERCIVCVEEPEIHLHPLLQRKLIRYLKENTSNQYLIATHSSSFIDTPDAAIFHVTNNGVSTFIREAVLRKDRYEVCRDLGARASDLVQANAVIWVEGPSDRIYLNWWIANHSGGDLIESIHYSVMFYGGRLLSHLSADDDEVTEFIQLRSLNRNLAILIDSDRRDSDEEINDTKKRVVSEMKQPAIAWVTEGREIENYVNYTILQQAVRFVHPAKYGRPASESSKRFAKALSYVQASENGRGKTVINEVDKIKIARRICETSKPDFTILDLQDRIAELTNFIRIANA